MAAREAAYTAAYSPLTQAAGGLGASISGLAPPPCPVIRRSKPPSFRRLSTVARSAVRTVASMPISSR